MKKLFNIFKDRKDNIDEVSYVVSKDAEKYIKKWLRRHNIRDIDLGEILFRIGISFDKPVILSKKSDGRDNFIQYQVGNVKGDLEFVDIPRPKIIVHGNENYSFVGYTFIFDNKKRTSLVKSDELIHKVYDNEFQLRVRVMNRDNFLCINFIYGKSSDDGISFSLIDYNYSGDFKVDEINIEMFQNYLRNLVYPASILDVYNEICKYLIIDNNRNISLKLSDGIKGGYRACLVITDNIISINENGLRLEYKREDNLSKIRICNDDIHCLIKYEEKSNRKLDYSKEEELIRRLMEIREPVSLIEVYKNICSKLLNVDEYVNFTLECYSGFEDVITICFVDGEFEYIEIVKNDKVIRLDKNEIVYTNKDLISEVMDLNNDTLGKKMDDLSRKRVIQKKHSK